MTLYYRDETIRVTSTTLEVHGRAYPLAHLERVWHQRGSRSWRAVAGRGALGATLLLPFAGAVLGVAIALRLDASTAVTVAVAGVAVLVGLAFGPLADVVLEFLDRSYARGARQMQIWAEIQGAPVLLFATGDALRFGKVYRALQRAVENAQPYVRR